MKHKRPTPPKPQPIAPLMGEDFIRRMELRKHYEDGMKEGIRVSVTKVMAAFVISLHENERMGKKRLQRVLESVNSTFRAIDDGVVDLEDLLAEAERCGVVLKSSDDNHSPGEQRAAEQNGG